MSGIHLPDTLFLVSSKDDEIRKLAERSIGATRKISNILLELQGEIQLAKESNDQQTTTIETSKSEMDDARSLQLTC